MATAPKFARVQHQDDTVNRVQDHLAKTLDPLVASPLNGAVLLKNIVLKTGVNIVPHSLANRPRGFKVARIHSTIQPIDWTPLSMQNNFVANTFGGAWPVASSRLTANGKVELKGLVSNSVSLPGTATAFALLTGQFRPADATANTGRLFAVPCMTNTNAGFIIRMDVWSAPPNGIVQLIWRAGPDFVGPASGATLSYLTLDGISWDAAVPPTPTLADNLDVQPEDPTKVIRITSSGPCTADLLFF